MPNEAHSQHEMMFELEALEEMIAGKCSVSAIDNSSHTAYLYPNAQRRGALTHALARHRLWPGLVRTYVYTAPPAPCPEHAFSCPTERQKRHHMS